ncbi:hypothetical protein BKA65DRAFT_567887 [Rhexocercosporidium sp. MPI-PUGE-AT-0058]|nr:hypothetical protein BKA65DRAFT_567887 [Rhexocercosporidium sp. MPI-PUGE-AT-0058]
MSPPPKNGCVFSSRGTFSTNNIFPDSEAPLTETTSSIPKISSIIKNPNAWEDLFADLKSAKQYPHRVDFTKLPKEVMLIILKFLEDHPAALNAFATSNSEIYEFANPLLYRHIKIQDLTSGYLLFCTLALSKRLASLTLSFSSEVQWVDWNPLLDSEPVRAHWKRVLAGDLMKKIDVCMDRVNRGGNYPPQADANRRHWDADSTSFSPDPDRVAPHPFLAANAFEAWDAITAFSILCLPNLQALSFPRWFESFDRGMSRIMHIYALVTVLGRKQRAQRNAGEKVDGPLLKLRSLDLLPSSPEGWRYFRTRWKHTGLLWTVSCFTGFASIKEMRILMDERVRVLSPPPPNLPSTSPSNPNSNSTSTQPIHPDNVAHTFFHSVIRLEKLVLVARWKEFPGVQNFLGKIVEGLAKGSLKSFRLRWLDENMYSSLSPGGWHPPLLALGIRQRILLPSEIGWTLRGVGGSLEELALPSHARIGMPQFLPFGPLNAFPKLRVLEGTLEMLIGRQDTGSLNGGSESEWDFTRPSSREWVLRWAASIPRGLIWLEVFTQPHLLDGLVGILAGRTRWNLETRRCGGFAG